MADHRYRISGWRRLPAAHRTARSLIVALIVVLAVAAGLSPAAATAAGAARDLTVRVTAFLWSPLLHED